MNKDKTIRLLEGQRYTNLTEVGPDVIRVERRHKGESVGVFYFDFSGVVALPDFDLQTYLQKQIASDFYKHEGALQWNYYLNFVLEKAAFRSFYATPRAAKVEADRTFARKRIWEQETLNAELAQPLAATIHSAPPSQDIASRWVEALKEAGLGRIAEPTAEYTQIVKDYLSGESKARKGISSIPAGSVPNGRFIRLLHRDHFRTHPAQEDFEFGTVNLLRGVNGTGKTSLLEAIELCICGGNRRQRGKRPAGAKLRIQFVGQDPLQRCPEASAAGYRARDLAWYGGYYRQGNQLCHNFGRFNFFDSDAAFQLSSATSGEEIVSAINALLLGEFATTIEQRMHQCKERFAREDRDLQRRVQVCRQEISKASQQIEQLKAIKDTREALLRELQARAEGCRWQKLPVRFKLDDLAVLQEGVEDSSTRFAQHATRLRWLARISIASLNRQAKQLGEVLKEMARQKDLARKNSEAWERTKMRVAELEDEVRILRRLQEYHVEPHALSLLGGGAAVKEARTRVTRLREAVTLLRAVDLTKFEGSAATLDEMAAQQEANIAQSRRNLAKLRTQAAALQTQLGMIKTVVEEIKGLGRRFCELSPQSTDCPLCGAHYDQLSARISSLEFGAPMESWLRKLTAETAREQANFAELQKAADTLTQLRRAAQVVFPPDQLASRATTSVVESFSSLGEKLEVERTKLDEIIAKESRLRLAGFEEEELQELVEVAQEAYSHARSQLMKKEGVQVLVTEKTKALEGLRNDGREKEKAQKEIDAELHRITRPLLDDAAVKDAGVELQRREAIVAEVLTEVRSAQKQVTISDTEEFSSVANRLDSFAKAVARIQEALKRIEEKDLLEQRAAASLSLTQGELARLEPRHARAKTASNLLDNLLGGDYKAAYLQQVLAQHRKKLSTLFSRIHAPHEFKDVNIDAGVLLERYTGVKSTVREISTGQRAALALSIFLSLNSSVSTRAPWLLFDEPVVHVDDLNILSFLDTLRDLVLLGNRQVFFATANTRIADLFAKKFDCLGPEFREFRFQR
ncbi:MAG: AAA family ATPase [Limisphaerales bacterium]